MEERLYFAVHPAKSDRIKVLEGARCARCGKKIKEGQFIWQNGFCYRCEQKRVLSEVYKAEGRIRKLEREYKELIR